MMVLYWIDNSGCRIDYMTFYGESLRSARKQARKLARNKMFHAINQTAVRIDICEGGLFGAVLGSIKIEK